MENLTQLYAINKFIILICSMEKYLNIKDSDELFKVNNIYCVGKNYLEHIKEFGSEEKPENPVIFLKPSSAIISNGGKVKIPVFSEKPISENLHYECELVVAIGQDCYSIPEEKADEVIKGYAIGLDMTLRDLQSDLKAKGLPWTLSKGFYTSAPCSDIIPKENISNPMDLNIYLNVNNVRKQFVNTSLMIYNIYMLISYISSIFYLQNGDLIFTGTPEGVGSVKMKDILEAGIENFINLKVGIE